MRQRDNRRVTLQQIARETGYSVNTVSRALRDKDDIAAQTRASIQQTARRMGYMVNHVASSLRSGRTHIIAVILGSMANPFYGIMTDTIQDAARTAGYSLMIMCARDDASLEMEMVEQALSQCVDGILLFPTARSAPTVDRLQRTGTPFVLMSRYLKAGEADSVVSDEVEGGRQAIRHLIEKGGRRIAFLANTDVVFSFEQRALGFHRACDEAGIPASNRRVVVFEKDFPGQPLDGALAETLVELKRSGFDSLFMFCDAEAWHAVDVLQRDGRLDRGDFRIVGFDNIEASLSLPASLCTVAHDYREIARCSIELLRSRIHQDERPPQTVICPTRLICRGSCK